MNCNYSYDSNCPELDYLWVDADSEYYDLIADREPTAEDFEPIRRTHIMKKVEYFKELEKIFREQIEKKNAELNKCKEDLYCTLDKVSLCNKELERLEDYFRTLISKGEDIEEEYMELKTVIDDNIDKLADITDNVYPIEDFIEDKLTEEINQCSTSDFQVKGILYPLLQEVLENDFLEWLDENTKVYYSDGRANTSDFMKFLRKYPKTTVCMYVERDSKGRITKLTPVGACPDIDVTQEMLEDYRDFLHLDEILLGWCYEDREEMELFEELFAKPKEYSDGVYME